MALLISRATLLTPVFIPETAKVQWFTAYCLLYGTYIIWICRVYFIVIQANYAAYWQFRYHHQHSISLLYIPYGIYDLNKLLKQKLSNITHRLDIANKNTYHLTWLTTASLTGQLQQNLMSSGMWCHIVYHDDRAASPAEMSVHFYTYHTTRRHIPKFNSLLSHHHRSQSYSGHLGYESVNTGVANWGYGGTYCFHISGRS